MSLNLSQPTLFFLSLLLLLLLLRLNLYPKLQIPVASSCKKRKTISQLVSNTKIQMQGQIQIETKAHCLVLMLMLNAQRLILTQNQNQNQKRHKPTHPRIKTPISKQSSRLFSQSCIHFSFIPSSLHAFIPSFLDN